MSESKRKAKLRESFFQICVSAYQSLTGDTREICICPLCGVGYTKDAFYGEEKLLTLEHVPPKVLGGKELLLTCKECNNSAGDTVDAALHMRERHNSLKQALGMKSGDYHGRIKLSMGGEKLNFDLKISNEESCGVELRPAGNCPKAFTRWRTHMKKNAEDKKWDGQQFNISTTHGFHQWLSKIGDLRIAYLIAFAAFGYRYIFNDRLTPIRHQLNNPKDQKLNYFWTFLGWGIQPKPVLAITHKPVDLVFIGLGNSNVILPWLDGPFDPYKEIESIISEGKSINFKGKKLKWPDKLRLELDFAKINNK